MNIWLVISIYQKEVQVYQNKVPYDLLKICICIASIWIASIWKAWQPGVMLLECYYTIITQSTLQK